MAVSILRAAFLFLLLAVAGTPVFGQATANTYSLDQQPTLPGAQFIVVRNFRVTDVVPTGKEREYALTLLAVTPEEEPDDRVVGGILFEIDGEPQLVQFQPGGVGDVVVKAQPGASEIRLKAVDSKVARTVSLPRDPLTTLLFAGGAAVLVAGGLGAWWWRRRRQRGA